MSTSVLVVDDEDLIRKLVCEALARSGYETSTACNGIEALDRMDGNRFDLVITDVAMPVMAGYELMRRVKRNWPSVKVVVLTGHPREQDISDFLLHGADEFLAKPFRLGDLVATVNRVLAREPAQGLHPDSTRRDSARAL